jgi:hypothetical protein
MTIRSKLLILLLAISLVPLCLLAAFSLRTTRELGDRVGEHSRAAMTNRELARLEEKLSDSVVIFRNHRALLEHLIRDQVRSVEAALADPAQSDSSTPADMIRAAGDFDAGSVPTVEDPRYQQGQIDGSQVAIPVSFERVSLLPAPSTRLADLATVAVDRCTNST